MEMDNMDNIGSAMQGTRSRGHKGYFGFKGRAFPLLGFIIGLGSILWTYYVAVTKSPPDV